MDLSRISKKNPHEDNRLTLNAIDAKTMDSYNTYYGTLSDKKKLLVQLTRKRNAGRSNYSNEFHELGKKIKDLEMEIQDIENKTQQINYLIKASSHFLEYSTSIPTSPGPSGEENNGSINKFFITSRGGNNKGKICQEYVKDCIGDGYSLGTRSSENNQDLTCINCGIEKLTNPRESYASCPSCGEITRYQDTQNNKGEYSEEVEVLSPFAYKKSNHFREWLNTLMGREGSGALQEVIDELLRELKKDKVESREEVTVERIRNYLKKLRHPKLYEHAPAIINKICGIPPPQISPKLEAKLIEMFQQIQAPFELVKNPERRNFLSYSYCIYKMLQLLKQDHLLEKLSLLKSREKLYVQDKIWSGICKILGWKFIRSL